MAYSNAKKQELLQEKVNELASILEEKGIPFGWFEKCSSYHIKGKPFATENALYVVNENIGRAFLISYFKANPNGYPSESGYQIYGNFTTKPWGSTTRFNRTDWPFNGDIFNPFTKEYENADLPYPPYFEGRLNTEVDFWGPFEVIQGYYKPSYNGHWCTDINDTIEAIEEFMSLKEGIYKKADLSLEFS